MKIKSDVTTKLEFKNATFEIDEDTGILMILEDLGDEGIVTNNFLDVIEKFLADKTLTVTIKNVSDNLGE